MAMKKWLLFWILLMFIHQSGGVPSLRAQEILDESLEQKLRTDCWKSATEITLLDTLRNAMKKEIEDVYRQHNFIQTFGCAYEETDIEKNSIKAVFRAITQSIINRKVTIRDDLLNLLRAQPPRPDNLTRDYVIYVNLAVDADIKAARYEIKILDLAAISTIESPMSVWTRLVTRFAYKEDYNKAPQPDPVQSEFVTVMENAQLILRAGENRNFGMIRESLNLKGISISHPARISELIFGDSMHLFNPLNPAKSFTGIFLGKGIFVCEIEPKGVLVCKFGEERLFNLLIDANSFARTTTTFASLDYRAPESILQCLLLKFSTLKPEELPAVTGN
ncbi:hypothetical protein L0128_12470 [candidate division KSB1 bacterium]|nr:hypothetical protein [candidate division KSB1 bacterium]